MTDPDEIDRRVAAHSGLRNDDVVDALFFMLTDWLPMDGLMARDR